ncbi:unnamed protein product [Schistosoma curassoni]|uniref:Reverse transcriptase domain-containing protein n=1 Tax=Schistosoma curassoni TaxID=6186 RepID=A0A183JCD1_9TREM|nr:unnamed protein product [Schistosoma curassoni]
MVTETLEEEQVPMDWKERYLIKIPKKGDLRKYENYRGITILSVPGNVFNRVLLNRMKDSVDAQLQDQQSGCHNDRSCTDQIATLRMVFEQSVVWNSVPQKIFNIIRNSYDLALLFHTHQQMQVKTNNVAEASASVDLNIHKGKTNILEYNTENTNPITRDAETLDEVETFMHLDSIIGEQGKSDADVKAKIGKATTAFLQLNNIWNSKQLSESQYQRENLQYERFYCVELKLEELLQPS